MQGGGPRHQKGVFDERFQEISTRSSAMQIPYSLVSEVSIQNFERRGWGIAT